MTHAPAPAAAAALPDQPELVLFTQKSKKRATVDLPHVRIDGQGNIYLSKPAVVAMDLHHGSRFVIGFKPDTPRDWFVFPVSSTDPDGFVLKLRRGESRSKANQVAKAQGQDVAQEYGGTINCKALALKFYESLGREPSSLAWHLVTQPETIVSPAHPHHTRCYPILTTSPISSAR